MTRGPTTLLEPLTMVLLTEQLPRPAQAVLGLAIPDCLMLYVAQGQLLPVMFSR